MPGHFKMASSGEPHNQRTVGFFLEYLAGMELEAACMSRRLRGESPDDLTKFIFVLEHAKGAIGESLQIKAGVAFESFLGNLGRADVLNHVEARGCCTGVVTDASHQIAAQAGQ